MSSEPKRRKLNSSNQSNPTTTFGHGCKGVFVTCDRNKESLAVKEVYRLLEDYIDSQKDPLEVQKEEATDLDAELAELERKDKPRQFTRLDLGMKGIAFVQILDESIDPVAAVQYIFHKAVETKSSLSRFAARIIPIQRTCYAHEEEVIAMIKEMIPAVFNDSTKGQSWFMQIKRRNNNTFDKELLIRSIAQLIDEKSNPVAIREGDICIHVDIDKGVCGAAIIPAYSSLNNLRTLLRSENEQNEQNESGELNQNPSKAKATGDGEKAGVDSMVDRLDGDWKCGACNAPNFAKQDVCWKCQHDRRGKGERD